MARYGQRVPAGMGGWLAFLLVTLVLNAGLAALSAPGLLMIAARQGTAMLATFHRVAAVVLAVQAAIYAWVIWRLLARRVPRTPRLAAAGLWVVALAWPLGTGVAATVLLGPGQIGAALGLGALRPLIYAAIWSAYLLNSERVAATYAGGDAGMADVFR